MSTGRGVSEEVAGLQRASQGIGESGKDWRQSKWLIVCELTVVVMIFEAAAWHLVPFSTTPFILALGCLSLWGRRVGWRRIGVTRFRSWKMTLGLGVGVGACMEIIELFVSQPLLVKLLHKQPNLRGFHGLIGNPKLALLGLALVWTLAAFGEEMVYRGYLMNRVADLFNRSRTAWVVSLIAVHVGFGLAHRYQGLTGIIDEGLMGVLLGLVYLGTKRNLAVPIVAHGVQDTIDLLLIFLGKYPGM